ncbi:zinc finger protein weckle-like [Anthonomus grandis grandis]|uniref:zinc finger protein weckle-like n=1 Tax=Anthonomus grandis grandis TaxID=2921223 RepID=UPI0021651E2A|nr:zinc finger protein weckle-like [Anthonomus grandis grandis]
MSFSTKPEKTWESYQEPVRTLRNQQSLSPTDFIELEYKCRHCCMGFSDMETCREHIQSCASKLLNPVSFILREEEDEPTVSRKTNNIVKTDPNLNDNESMESYAFGADDATNDTHFSTPNTDMSKILEELDNDLIELDSTFAKPTKNTTNCLNTEDSLEAIQDPEEQDIIIETFTDQSSNEENVKILRVLNLPKNKTPCEEGIPLQTLKQSLNAKKSKGKLKLRKPPGLLPLEQISIKPLPRSTEELKPKPHVRTYAKQKGSNASKAKKNKKLVTPVKKMYSVIERPKPVETEETTTKSVFDFVDEEDEKKKIQDEMHRKKLKEISQRTCQICGAIFDDPIYVLRHKREKHPTKKVQLPKEKLKVYLELDCRPICPLCFKQIPSYQYRSIYTKHILTHTADPEFECEICGQKYKRKDHLENHKKRHVYGVS